MGNFLHSKSKEHTTYLIDRFVDKNKKINGSPMYIIGRIIGGITDPSSLFLFTKAIPFHWFLESGLPYFLLIF